MKGKNDNYKKHLIDEMKLHSKSQNYEQAANLRDRIKALSKITSERYSDLNSDEDFDIIFLKNKYDNDFYTSFFIRAGKNLGNKDFLFSDLIFEKSNEVLEQFMIFLFRKYYSKRNITQSKVKKYKNYSDLLKKITIRS